MTLAIGNTPELRRIVALPRRTTPAVGSAAARELVRFWTRVMRVPGGTQVLSELQAIGLEEAANTNGALYLSAAVGAGKTLEAFLLLALFEAERGVIVAPSGMHDEMRRMHDLYRQHWLAPPAPPRFVGFEELDRAEVNPWIEIAPDAIVFDESHRARRRDRIAVKHTHRYFKLIRRGLLPAPRLRVCMTATPGRKSILDHAHQLVWVLGEAAPVPQMDNEQKVWAGALDLDGRQHFGVGALRALSADCDGRTLVDKARRWYYHRLADTPGIVLSSEDSCDKALSLIHIVPPADAKIEAAFRRFREDFETPGGDTVSDPLEGFRLEQELSVGYYGVWDPPPPLPWLKARKVLHAFVRTQVQGSQRSRQPLDTAARVMKAFPDAPQVQAWLAVKDTYRVTPKPVWLSASVVQFVADWLKANGPALCYVWSVPFCQALQRATGLTWYGRKGLDAFGRYVGDDPGTRSVIVSGQANTEGRNLQHRWHKAAYVAPPQSGQWLEQAFGRIHRQLQKCDVEIYLLIASMGALDGFAKACAEAEFGNTLLGLDQKIRRAHIVRATMPRGTYRWA